ncbi:glycosyltransferase [Fulvivirga lutea]|uniref:Glycosyltransferase n=1 Tax=Fulvivirga lutea TaxID=2810512 RepID=A0A975A1P4_9BACT|nr:glycosyltransferase [Fulvivirga lutea]QSE98440.1 glycosyltransferase [Fulvivirga lutea]
MKILFLTPYPRGVAPSQRFRFEQYYTLLKEKGVPFEIQSFLNYEDWKILYINKYAFLKVLSVVKGFIKRFFILFRIKQFDYIFIHREASPIGPPILEWLIVKVFSKKIVYDFDDAIWIPNVSDENKIISKLKWYSKVSLICSWSYKVSCGNSYLASFASQYNSNILINPTTIDTENLHNPSLFGDNNDLHKAFNSKLSENQTVIGWTGTHTTMKYLKIVLPVIQRLHNELDFRFLIISNKAPTFKLEFMEYIPWNLKTEINDLLSIDIGIMPLAADKWSEGKCGFKILQYMSLEKVAVASPVGINSSIISNGVNGYICKNNDEWYVTLKKLINDTDLRKNTGAEGRKTVLNYYSVKSNQDNFLSLFE